MRCRKVPQALHPLTAVGFVLSHALVFSCMWEVTPKRCWELARRRETSPAALSNVLCCCVQEAVTHRHLRWSRRSGSGGVGGEALHVLRKQVTRVANQEGHSVQSFCRGSSAPLHAARTGQGHKAFPAAPQTTWLLLGYYLATTWLLSWLLLGYYLATTWLLLGYYLATTWLLLGYYLATTWLLLGYYLATTWLLLGYYLATTWPLLASAQELQTRADGACGLWCS